jgi:hypothetical protein
VAPDGKDTAWKSSESSTAGLIPAACATSTATPREIRAISAGAIGCGARVTPSAPLDASISSVKSLRTRSAFARTAASGVSVWQPGSV